ncbi:unnamed protein product [Ceutorhynchus assimilis]|uniref:Death domain-containing protein n=1 Tax=Ceutorhynchus assimilis TaxID=467358 RepID=A0A9N9MVZ4_9CUCU|nr:unnamed protein product [Ceutorhynchus assimilis]
MSSITQNQYLAIRDILLHLGCHAPRLQRLKTNFQSFINSQRVFEKIDSLNYLFKILEKRDVLGPEHWNNLEQIIQEVAPDNYEIQTILAPTPIDRDLSNRVLPPVLPDPVQRIDQMIKDCIGISWREFARGFSIPEGRIVNLDQKYQRDIERITHEILRVHHERCGDDWEVWRVDLQRALKSAKRLDLVEDIDDILTRNPIRRV